MSLWRNKIDQEINEIFDILFLCISNVLELLDLEDCHLSGYIPDYLGKFKNLGFLSISKNSIAGPIPIPIGNLESTNDIDLSLNNLNGTLPISFGGLPKLVSVDLSHNALDGDVSEIHFENLTNLVKFFASRNKFRLRVGSDWIPPRNLTEVDLDGWSIGPEFPRWVKSMNRIDYLNLANSGIDSQIPAWFWDLPFNFYCLNLSHNQIHGVIPEKPSFKGNQVFESFPSVVDLSSNNFQGPLPYIFSNSEGLHLSNNSFSGPLSNFLCHNMHELRNLRVLDIGDNLLSEDMPDCWVKWERLEFLNLNNNKLSGKISQSIGALIKLHSLHLRNNSLSGEIPLSLGNCTKLYTIDLSENELIGNIPTWIGENFLKLTILSAHTNKFDGVIPEKLCLMMNLHVLDLANNKLSGTIPKCLNNFGTMASDGDSTYMDSVEDSSFSYFGVGTYQWAFFDYMLLGLKGKMDTYNSILKLVRAIDLSRNKLTGEIPEEITSLRKLIYLNLSQNLLTGRIPAKIGDMKSLEVLDFSLNELFGEIPQSLAEITFLSLLNLSFNNFKGRIPLGTQIQSFSPSSFMGNEELCGAPLPKNCSRDGEIPGTDSTKGGNDGDGDEINWLYVSMPLGFVVGFWCTFGP